MMSSCSTQEQLAKSFKHNKCDEVAKTGKLDCVNSHQEKTPRIAVHNILATCDLEGNNGGSDCAQHRTSLSRNKNAKLAKKDKREVSVYDIEPDDEEELNGTQCLEIIKNRRSEKVLSLQEDSLKPTLSFQKVLQQLASENSALSAKGEKSQEFMSKKVKSKPPMIDMSIDKKKKKHDVSKCSSNLQNAKGNIDTDFGSCSGGNNIKSSVMLPTTFNTDCDAPRKASVMHREESNRISTVSSISASITSVSELAGKTMCAMRQSGSISNLPLAPRFSNANFMTSTPLPSRHRSLTGNCQSVSAVTMSVNRDGASGTDVMTADNLPLAKETISDANIISAQKQQKRKKLSMLSVTKIRRTSSGIVKKLTKKSVAG